MSTPIPRTPAGTGRLGARSARTSPLLSTNALQLSIRDATQDGTLPPALLPGDRHRSSSSTFFLAPRGAPGGPRTSPAPPRARPSRSEAWVSLSRNGIRSHDGISLCTGLGVITLGLAVAEVELGAVAAALGIASRGFRSSFQRAPLLFPLRRGRPRPPTASAPASLRSVSWRSPTSHMSATSVLPPTTELATCSRFTCVFVRG